MQASVQGDAGALGQVFIDHIADMPMCVLAGQEAGTVDRSSCGQQAPPPPPLHTPSRFVVVWRGRGGGGGGGGSSTGLQAPSVTFIM